MAGNSNVRNKNLLVPIFWHQTVELMEKNSDLIKLRCCSSVLQTKRRLSLELNLPSFFSVAPALLALDLKGTFMCAAAKKVFESTHREAEKNPPTALKNVRNQRRMTNETENHFKAARRNVDFSVTSAGP